MKDSIPFYFPGATYHTNNKELDALFEKHGIEWDADAKIWSGLGCEVSGTFNGYKRPAILRVIGTDNFIKDMKSFADSVGAVIKDKDVIDIKKVRNAEREKKRIADEIKKKEKEDAEIKAAKKLEEEKEAFESVLRVKIDGMRNAEMSDVGIRNWIYMEMGIDISDRFGLPAIKVSAPKPNPPKLDNNQQGLCEDDDIEDDVPEVKLVKPVVKTNKSPKVKTVESEKPRDGFISFVCKSGNHEACGGQTCTCPCHKK